MAQVYDLVMKSNTIPSNVGSATFSFSSKTGTSDANIHRVKTVYIQLTKMQSYRDNAVATFTLPGGGTFTINYNATSTGTTTISKTISNPTAADWDWVLGSVSGKTIKVSTSNVGNTNAIRAQAQITVSVVLEQIYVPTVISCNDIQFGTVQVAQISNVGLKYLNHKLTYSLRGYSNTGTITIPRDTSAGTKADVRFQSGSTDLLAGWIDSLTNVTFAYVDVQLETYAGTSKVGNTYKTSFMISIPQSNKPQIKLSLQATSTNAKVQQWISQDPDLYIRTLCGIKLQITQIPHDHSAEITTYIFTSNTDNIITQDVDNKNIANIVSIRNAGQIILTGRVVDARGRSSDPVSITIRALNYNTPSVLSYSAVRGQVQVKQGTTQTIFIPSSNGTYAQVKMSGSVSNLGYDGAGNPRNTKTMKFEYSFDTSPDSKVAMDVGDIVDGMSYAYPQYPQAGIFDPDNTYTIYFTVTDAVGNSAMSQIVLRTSPYAIHARPGGTGIAFGKMSEYDSCVEIEPSWLLRYAGVQMPVIVYSNDEPDISKYYGRNILWLKPQD